MTKKEFQMYLHGTIAIEDDAKYMHPACFKREEEDGYTYTYYGAEFDVEDIHVNVYNKMIDDINYNVAEINGSIVAKARVDAGREILVEVYKYIYGNDDYTEYLR